MRWPLAAVGFIVAGFLFLAFFGFASLLMTSVSDAITDNIGILDATGQTNVSGLITLIQTAFGVISAIFFATGVILFFVLESLSDEPEYYYRER